MNFRYKHKQLILIWTPFYKAKDYYLWVDANGKSKFSETEAYVN